MTLAELIATYRLLTDDIPATAAGSDEEITDWLNEAERQAAFRARFLIDALVSVAITVGRAEYVVGSNGIWIRRAKLAASAVPLAPVDYRDLDRSRHGWQSQTGTPTHHVRGLESLGQPLAFRPYPVPTATGTVTLVIVREPLEPMAADGDEPEIEARWHEDLVHWAMYRGFSRPDADFYDADKALGYYARFEAIFGTREAAIAAEAQAEREMANPMPYAVGTF